MRSPIRWFRRELSMAVQEAIALSPFERRGVHADFVSMDMARLSARARTLGFHGLAVDLGLASRMASDRYFTDEGLLRLCLWTPEEWARHDAEPLEGVD